MKLTAILVAACLAIMPTAAQTNDYDKALRLYDKGVLSHSSTMFERLAQKTAESDPVGYSVLCDVRLQVRGYENKMNAYFAEYPYSTLIPQITYRHALNLFDAGNYAEALQQFAKLKLKSLYKDQRMGLVFKTAYSNLECGHLDVARKGFVEVDKGERSDYTAPAQYAIGYIDYTSGLFREALGAFEKAVKDHRFKEVASYYIFECKFLLKDYDYVIKHGKSMVEAATAERKPHLARLVSEAYLVRGDLTNAQVFYQHTLNVDKSENTRSDWFFRGSLMYALKDYKGAVENYLNMKERRDSIGQIANYNMGYSYIKMKDKVSALNAFKDASTLGFDPVIAEDAMFNYAKLEYDINKNISVIEQYMQKYPAKDKADLIYGYMAVAALRERNYEAAVEAFDKIDELDVNMRQNFMKSNYLRANQLIKNGSYRMAIPCLKAAAYYSDKRSGFNQLARFWLAESYFRDGQFAQARGVYSDLYNISALDGRQEASLIPFNIAYCYFKEEDYKQAQKWFAEYLREPSQMYRKEALIRKADCDFVAMNYKAAADAYDVVLKDYFNVNDIYPYYQAALSYGLQDNVQKKIELLSNVMEASPESYFYPEAMFELGRTYAVKESDEDAFKCFDKLVQNVKDSTYVAKAYIEMGSLARNQSMFNEALGYYKIVVEQMPYSEYADDALLAVESIYQTKNDPQEYLAYIESIGKGGVKTDAEKEDMIFNSAEQIFLSENYQKALVSLQSYLDAYGQGKYVYKADFYMAESYRALERFEQACDSYKKVIEKGEGSFVELSMLNFAKLSFMLEKWNDAFRGYSSLYESAVLPNNRFVATVGQMRSAFRGHDWDNAVKWSGETIGNTQADAGLKREAEYIMAKSYLSSGRREESFAILERLSADVNDAYGAEAAYLLIMDSYDRGAFEDVETKVYAFADAGSPQDYWRAKCFIVLGDSYAERDEMEQAKATFESIRDAYVPSGENDDVHDNIAFRLKRIEEFADQAQ